MVVWIIGLSGSGKSYLARSICKKFKKKKIIWIDGDNVRKYITYDLGYSIKDRKKNSLTISNICKFLENKGFIVVCSILSIFKDHQKRNRKIFKKYIQVYIKSNIEKLKKTNSKKIYSNKRNVVGVNIKFPTPYKSDLTIEKKNNHFETKKLNEIYNKIR